MTDWLLNALWVAPALFLLLGMPALNARSKKKYERVAARNKLELELVLLHADRAREGLEAKLLADLQAVMVQSVLRSAPPGGLSMELIRDALHGEIPEGLEDVQLRRPDDEFKWYFWPTLKPPRVKR